MTDPTASQTVAALVERKGAGVVAIAVLRRYWKPVTTVAGSLIAFGVFLNKFDPGIKGQEAENAAIGAMAARAQAGETQQAVMTQKQNDEEARWDAVTTAADIVVTPRKPRRGSR